VSTRFDPLSYFLVKGQVEIDFRNEFRNPKTPSVQIFIVSYVFDDEIIIQESLTPCDALCGGVKSKLISKMDFTAQKTHPCKFSTYSVRLMTKY